MDSDVLRFLTLCQIGWQLYDESCLSGNWRKYLQHRKSCKECRIEEK